jgi:hypothetical protein
MASDVDDVISCGACDLGLRRNPDESFAWWQFDPLHRLQHRLDAGGVVWSAMNPDGLAIGSRAERLFLGRTGDSYERDGANALSQAFNPAADGRQSRFVTDEKPPIEGIRNHERASGAADLYDGSDLSLFCPADRRTGWMHRDVDGQLFGFGIEMSWGEITTFEVTSFARNIQLDMIVSGWRGEVVEGVTAKDYS